MLIALLITERSSVAGALHYCSFCGLCSRNALQYSPTQRIYFVCNYCFAGARYNHAKTSYKLNAADLPEVAYIQNEYHADLTLPEFKSLTQSN